MRSLQHLLFRGNQYCNFLLIVVCDNEEFHGLLKRVLKPYNNSSHRQFDIMEIVYGFPGCEQHML